MSTANTSHYRINVARRARYPHLSTRHFFAVEVLSFDGSAEEVIAELAKRFPASEGFEVTASEVEVTSSQLGTAEAVANDMKQHREQLERDNA